jgi:hypothetical protein
MRLPEQLSSLLNQLLVTVLTMLPVRHKLLTLSSCEPSMLASAVFAAVSLALGTRYFWKSRNRASGPSMFASTLS